MPRRIHIVVDDAEKERFRRRAAREGKTLSQWLRDAAREKLAAEEARVRLDSRAALEEFFRACDAHERGKEPDWSVHRRAIEASIRSGGSAA